jgi:hypothetical protein
MFYYLSPLSSGTAGQELALAIDRNDEDGGLIVVSKAHDPAQWWSPVLAPNGGTFLVSVYSQQQNRPRIAYAPTDRARILQTPLTIDSIQNDSATWTIGGHGLTKVPVRPSHNDGMNMNVSGYGPYSDGNPVIIYNWCDGSDNEVWTFVLVVP